MSYKLYLDDLRYPPDTSWVIARNYHDAVWYVKNKGVPDHISFDHDLADVHYDNEDYGHNDGWMDAGTAPHEFTGYDFAKWFCNYVMDNDMNLDNFTYAVHSANPVGAENIRRYMDAFMRDRYV